jgi:phage repressor protein C with HTH and peptisase S24 domain
MKTIDQIRRENALALIEANGLTHVAFAQRVDMSAQQAHQILSSRQIRNIGPQMARRIESAFNKATGWLDQDHSLEFRPAPSRTVAARPVLAWDHEDELSSAYVLVPRLNVKASAGNGKLIWEVDEKGQKQAFRRSWMERLGIDPSNAATIVAEGSSMAPRVEDGDSLVVDYKATNVVSGKVYALTFSGELFVKRLFRMPTGGVRIVSDNPDKTRYPDWDVLPEQAENLSVIARVVGVSGAI